MIATNPCYRVLQDIAYLDIERKGIQNYVIFLLPAACCCVTPVFFVFSLGCFVKRSFKEGK
jgi:ABC-type multidrug transport system permease subunit